LSELEDLLAAFDAEVEQFGTANAAVRKFIATTAQRQREGLVVFYQEHGRLPRTTGELLSSGLSVPRMRNYKYKSAKLVLTDDWPVVAYLQRTQDEVDGRDYGGDMTVRSLRLVHAVYRAHDPISNWRKSAAALTDRGFSEEQIRLLRTDAQVRRACRRLLQPYER